jgi:hypothetical protein
MSRPIYRWANAKREEKWRVLFWGTELLYVVQRTTGKKLRVPISDNEQKLSYEEKYKNRKRTTVNKYEKSRVAT